MKTQRAFGVVRRFFGTAVLLAASGLNAGQVLVNQGAKTVPVIPPPASTQPSLANARFLVSKLDDVIGFGVFAYDINNSGQVVGNRWVLGVGLSGYIWHNGQYTANLPPTDSNHAFSQEMYSINDNGDVAGLSVGVPIFDPERFESSAPTHVALWRGKTGGWTATVLPHSAGTAVWTPLRVNNNEQIVGTVNHYVAVTYQEGVTSNLPNPFTFHDGPQHAAAYSINNHGVAVGFVARELSKYSFDGTRQASYWDTKGHHLLPSNGNRAEAFGLNDIGQIVGYSNDGILGAFGFGSPVLWDGGTKVSLGNLIGEALDINKYGQIVGWGLAENYEWRALLWDNLQLIDLNTRIPADSGWILTEARAINDSGMILCEGQYNGTPNFCVLTPYQASLAVDANRDGVIKFTSEDASDITSDAAPYRFWLNDDDDNTFFSMEWSDSDPEHYPARRPDFKNQYIDSPRDCEDLSRIWLYLGGLSESLTVQEPNLYLGLKWRNIVGSPSIRLFRSVDADGGLDHIRNVSIAAQQTASLSGSPRYCLADVSAVFVGSNLMEESGPWEGTTTVQPQSQTDLADFVFKPEDLRGILAAGPKGHLLFEGVSEGKGELVVVIIRRNSDGSWGKVSEGSSVWLQLENIRRMYVRVHATPSDPDFVLPWRVSTPAPWPYEESTVATEAKALSVPDSRLGYVSGDSQEEVFNTPFVPSVGEQAKCVVFVHGIDLTVGEQQGYAQSFFKRLWWEGYRGRFIAFRWSTPLSSDGLFGWRDEGTSIYNSGEYRAFKGGTSLRKFVAGLGTPGNPFYLGSGALIGLAAHSQGNITAGEALRQGMQVNSYVALEAAVPLSCYHSAAETLPAFPRFSAAETLHRTTASHGGVSPRYNGYFSSLGSSAKISYHSADDFWLVTGTAFAGSLETNWIANNEKYKPDGVRSSGNYRFDFLVGPFYETPAFTLRGITDAHESMAFVCRSMTLALGAVAPSPVFTSGVNLKTQYGFGVGRPDHSGQFQRDIQFMYGDENGVAWGEPLYGRLMRDLQVSP